MRKLFSMAGSSYMPLKRPKSGAVNDYSKENFVVYYDYMSGEHYVKCGTVPFSCRTAPIPPFMLYNRLYSQTKNDAVFHYLHERGISMADRPHSRKTKVKEGTAEVRKGEKVSGEMKASDRMVGEGKEEKTSDKKEG
ncbi:MAG: hypothetical protein Q4G47_08665 [Lachnospiraceae bacterium]|nr:hypothetical protein [Lachnospiraceae bacterium]